MVKAILALTLAPSALPSLKLNQLRPNMAPPNITILALCGGPSFLVKSRRAPRTVAMSRAVMLAVASNGRLPAKSVVPSAFRESGARHRLARKPPP